MKIIIAPFKETSSVRNKIPVLRLNGSYDCVF